MTPAEGQDIQRQPSKPFNPVATVERHWFKIAVFGTVLFIMVLPVLLMMKSPYFSAAAKLRISPVVPALITRSDERTITGYYNSYVQTQVDKIKTLKNIEIALEQLSPDIKKIYAPKGMPLPLAAELIQRRLIVIHVTGTHLISVTLGGTRPEGLAEMVNAVVDAYMSRLQEEEEGRDNRRILYLQKDKDAREQEVARLTQLLTELTLQADTSTFSEMHNVHTPALIQLQHAYVRAHAQRIEKENALRELQSETEALKQISLEPLVGDMVENNDALNQIDFYTYQQLQNLRSSIDGVSVTNPDKKYIDARMQAMQDYLKTMREDIRLRSREVIYGKREVEQQQRLIRAEAEFRQARAEEQEIIRERDRLQQLKNAISLAILRGRRTEERLEHQQTMLNRIDERINDLRLEAMAPGRVSLESGARAPRLPEGGSSKKVLLLAVMLSFGVVAGACFGFDILDRRVRSRKDFASAVGAPPAWPISDYLRCLRPDILFDRVTIDDPRCTVAIALNSLSVHLDRERRTHDGRIAVFTGVNVCSGVTGIALNTAHALSRMCSPVLVIDANLLHPQVGGLTGSGIKPGLEAILAGSAGIDDCILTAAGRGFDILPLQTASQQSGDAACGSRSAFPGILQELRTRYSIIIIDAPPVLRHDLTEYLLVHADIAVLVVQGDRSSYGETYMAADIILKLQVPALAPVLNWGAPRQRTRSEEITADILRHVEREIVALPRRLMKAYSLIKNRRST
jgi:polysaccharide biosynthesis transport protein